MAPSRDNDRSPLAAGMQWATQVTTISLEMALPALGGYWLDQRWGTGPWLVIVGALLGFAVALGHLLQIARQDRKP